MQKNPSVAKEETYAGIYGVYLPEKARSNSNGQNRKFQNMDSPFHCSRSDDRFAFYGGIKDYFAGCIDNYNNPDALKSNDNISLQPAHKGGRDPAHRKKFEENLKAYSWVRIPSG